MQLVEDLWVSTQELLDENSWVDEETKRLVAEKLEGMLVLAGLPEWVSNVSSLDRFYNKVCVACIASGHSVCSCSIIIVFLLYSTSNVLSFPAVSVTRTEMFRSYLPTPGCDVS